MNCIFCWLKTCVTHLPHTTENLSKRAKLLDHINIRLMASVRFWDYYNKPVDLEYFLAY
jgi:hypothetical protein